MSFSPPCRVDRLAVLSLAAFTFFASYPLAAQTQPKDVAASSEVKPQPGQVAPAAPSPEDKRVLGVLPNYRTANGLAPFQRITAKEKFTIATKDSVDYPVFFTTAFFAGVSQLSGDNSKVYGGGVKAFAHRYGISYADQVIGNLYPEAIVPVLFHVDPRYFRKSEGSAKSRFAYAVSRLFVCKDDNGNLTFNSPEFVGNGMASLTALSYHVGERTAGDAVSQFGNYLATDLAGQILKEFWPDIKRRLHSHGSND